MAKREHEFAALRTYDENGAHAVPRQRTGREDSERTGHKRLGYGV